MYVYIVYYTHAYSIVYIHDILGLMALYYIHGYLIIVINDISTSGLTLDRFFYTFKIEIICICCILAIVQNAPEVPSKSSQQCMLRSKL